MLNIAQASFATANLPVPELSVKNYLESSLPADADAIICNPPYTRHHHISPDVKDRLQGFFKGKFGVAISRKATMAFVRTIQRNREIQDIILDEKAWQALSREGKRVGLLYLNGENLNRHPALSTYLAEGEAKGYHNRSLVQTRKQWYFMEQRELPAIFFTILTRDNPRFILNQAGVRPLNMFLLLYPNSYVVKAGCIEHLWVLLNSTFSLSRLHSVSRTYGGNTLKVEPRELDNLPVINPLALPDEIRQRISELINEFYRHRDAPLLIRETDALIDTLLDPKVVAQHQSPLPVQLQLFEPQKNY